MRLFILINSLLLCLCVAAPAADFAGNWKAETKLKDGTPVPYVLTLKSSGNSLAGSFQTGQRKERLVESAVTNGDAITFFVTEISEAGAYKLFYKGKLEGEQLSLIGEREDKEGKLVKVRDLSFSRK